jgi:hypothetical protein
MFTISQVVKISSTSELTTRYNGQTGTIQKQWKSHPEFFTVLTDDGNTTVFHQSQLQVVAVNWSRNSVTGGGRRTNHHSEQER